MKPLHLALTVFASLGLAACKHTLQIEGQGDIVEMLAAVRGCSLEEFQAQKAKILGS